MNNDQKLRKINNEIKSYVNEANFISMKMRNKIIKLLADSFSIQLPLENFANIDVALDKNGNIIMRGDKYETSNKIKSFEEIEEKYSQFKEKAEILLKNKTIDYYSKQDKNNIINLLIILLIIIVFIFLIIHTIKSFIYGNYIHCIWLFLFITSWLIPSLGIRDRFDQAKNYIKRKLKK